MATNAQELSTEANETQLAKPKQVTAPVVLEDSSKKKYGLYSGLIFSSLASVFMCFSSVIMKQTRELDFIQLNLNGSIGIFVFTIPFVIYYRQNFFGPKQFWHLLIARGTVGMTNLCLLFISFRYLPFAEASLIISTAPVFVAIFARIFLKEPCKITQIIVLCISMVGIFLITRMPLVIAEWIVYSKEQVIGVSAAVGSSLFHSFIYILARRVNALHYSVIMFNVGWVSIIELTIITFAANSFGLTKCGTDQWLVVLFSGSTFLGLVLLTISLQQDQPALIAMVKGAMEVILAFFWQIVFFRELPDIYSISGAVLIFFSVLIIGLSKWILSVPKDSATRKRLNFLTL